MVNEFGGWGQNGVFSGGFGVCSAKKILKILLKILPMGYSETFFSIDYSLAIHEIQC